MIIGVFYLVLIVLFRVLVTRGRGYGIFGLWLIVWEGCSVGFFFRYFEFVID